MLSSGGKTIVSIIACIVAGGLTLLFLFLSPSLGIVVLTVVLAGIGASDDLRAFWGKWGKILVITLLTLGVGILALTQDSAEQSQALFRSGTCILNTQTGDNQSWQFSLGGNQESFSNGAPARNQMADDPLNVSLENNQINIQATVRDSAKDVLAYINGDVFHAQAPGVEFNCDDKAVEVKDAQGNIVFQLDIDDANQVIYIYGLTFPQGSIYPTCATPSGMIINDTQTSANGCSLNPMFKYPSDEYQGVRV